MRFWPRRRPARAAKPVCSFRPRLEALEDRCVPAIDMVTNLSGSAATPGSLPNWVANANPNDTIQFASKLNGGSILLGNTLDINQWLTIEGAGSGITVNGAGHEVFVIEAGSMVTINGLTITGGVATGGYGSGIYNAGSLSLTNSTVTGNSAISGGGIYNASGGLIAMSGDTVSSNTVWGGERRRHLEPWRHDRHQLHHHREHSRLRWGHHQRRCPEVG
jgi:hypothetical protein